jgi:hypothetical protein
MLGCSVTIADVEAEFSNAVETYVHPHLPDQMLSALELADAVMEIPGVRDAMMMAAPGTPRQFAPGGIVPYSTKLPSGSGLQKHHGVIDVWAQANIPGYSRDAAPSVLMSDAQHNATRRYFGQWRTAKTGNMTGQIDWSTMSPREVQSLSEAMFDAAGISPAVRAQYYAEFDRYIYGLISE